VKTCAKNSFLLSTLITVLGFILAGRVMAQTFAVLHSFTDASDPYFTNRDGTFPSAGLLLSGNILYGTASSGGGSGNGTVFGVSTDGKGFTNLHSFNGVSDGNYPQAGLILLDNTLFGTTAGVRNADGGTVYAVNTDGTGFTNLYSFLYSFTEGSNGWAPYARLTLSGTTLYGTTVWGGSSWAGTVFRVNTDGTGFTNLHSFANGSNGAYPWAGLVLASNTLYGTTGWPHHEWIRHGVQGQC
jgi:uncharacterized repeat protein (TIGR03803 family)